MMNDRELQELLVGAFPDNVAVAASVNCPADASLLEPEHKHTVSMIERRVREFTHGRHNARLAMQALGLPPAAVAKNDDRSPVWPDAVRGTISHTGEIAAAVIAHPHQYQSLGLDIEDAEPLDAPAHRLILRPEERDADGARAKLLFSIKEAIYKCLYPVIGAYIDFQEMAVDTDEAKQSFRALPHTDLVPAELAARLEGRYRITPQLVIATAWIKAD